MNKHSKSTSYTKQYKVTVFNYTVFILSISENSGWFRLFGVGISWSDTRSFSERYGLKDNLIIGKVTFTKIK